MMLVGLAVHLLEALGHPRSTEESVGLAGLAARAEYLLDSTAQAMARPQVAHHHSKGN